MWLRFVNFVMKKNAKVDWQLIGTAFFSHEVNGRKIVNTKYCMWNFLLSRLDFRWYFVGFPTSNAVQGLVLLTGISWISIAFMAYISNYIAFLCDDNYSSMSKFQRRLGELRFRVWIRLTSHGTRALISASCVYMSFWNEKPRAPMVKSRTMMYSILKVS